MKTMKSELVKYLLKVQKCASEQVWPGYPFRDSVIIDLSNDKCYQERTRATTFRNFLKELKNRCFDYVLGCQDNQKGSWYFGEPQLEKAECFTSYDFDDSKLYIDEPLVARYYLAIMSAYNEVVKSKKDNVIIFADVDLNEDYVFCKTYTSVEQAQENFEDFLKESEE